MQMESDLVQAIVWAEKELKSKLALWGFDSLRVERTKAWIETPEEDAWTDTSSEASERPGRKSATLR